MICHLSRASWYYSWNLSTVKQQRWPKWCKKQLISKSWSLTHGKFFPLFLGFLSLLFYAQVETFPTHAVTSLPQFMSSQVFPLTLHAITPSIKLASYLVFTQLHIDVLLIECMHINWTHNAHTKIDRFYSQIVFLSLMHLYLVPIKFCSKPFFMSW